MISLTSGKHQEITYALRSGDKGNGQPDLMKILRRVHVRAEDLGQGKMVSPTSGTARTNHEHPGEDKAKQSA